MCIINQLPVIRCKRSQSYTSQPDCNVQIVILPMGRNIVSVSGILADTQRALVIFVLFRTQNIYVVYNGNLHSKNCTTFEIAHNQCLWVIKKEGNVLFNDALITFYLRLYSVRHMVKDNSDSERGNPLPPYGLLFPINSKGSFICTIPQTG